MTLLNGTMTPIQTITVGSGGQAAIEFTNIPQTYTDLVLKISARTDTAFTADEFYAQFNGLTTGLTHRLLIGRPNIPDAVSNTSSTGYFNGNTATSSTFGSAEIYIPNYNSTSTYKSMSTDSVTEGNASTTRLVLGASLWSSNSAITSIRLVSTAAANFMEHSSATLYGVTSAAVGAKATGGIISQDADYFYHTFLASGTFTPTQSITADYLVVAGGGGASRLAGGGAGGLRSTVTTTGGGGSLESALSLTAQSYTVTVGAGGAQAEGGNAFNGSNSVFSTITSTGGGGAANANATGSSGGSGGGGWAPGVGGAGTANQGFVGGNPNPSPPYDGGGGGGAGEAGNTDGTSEGGDGVAVSISGSSVNYAGGGAGSNTNATVRNGGAGGGGNGGSSFSNGTVNSGGGAGANGGGTGGLAGAGGSGIVIVRYPK